MKPALLELVGNTTALVVLVWKTWYDLLWNPRRFKQEAEGGQELPAARAKRDRTDRSNLIAFIGLAVSQLMLILKVLYELDTP